MFKRIALFLLTNIAVIVVLTIIIAILEQVFGIQIGRGSTTGILILALIIGFGGSFISISISRWMAKRAYGIKPIMPNQVDELSDKEKLVWNTVEELSERNGIKMPEVGFYNDQDPNAFATGASKNKSLVAVSSGLLDSMDNGAIEGVVAHEMAHILNGDMVTMALLQGVLNTFVIFFAKLITNLIASFLDEEMSWIAYLVLDILLQIIFGILASLIAMKFSRYREYRADEGSARFVGKEKMIAGLMALKSMQNLASKDEGNLAAMKISTKKRGGIMALFSSHPDLDDRIKAVQDLNI